MDRANWFSAAMIVLAMATWIGCGPTKKTPDKGTTVKPGHGDHDHAEDEHPPHGPNGGHVVTIKNADKKGEVYQVEWKTDDDEGKVIAYSLDADLKDEVAIAADVVSIDVTSSDGATKSYWLVAANNTGGDKPTASRFEIANQALVTILSNKDVKAKILVNIKGTEFSGKIVFHQH